MSTLSYATNDSTSSNSSLHTLNAAFLQEIKEDSIQLRELLQKTSHMLSMPRRACSRELVETLNELCDQLAMHFSLENAFGYLDHALEMAPRLCRRARALRNEHDALFGDFKDIVEEAEQLLYHEQPRRQLTRVAVMYFDFQARLQAHEACENELIFEAFDDDLGVGD